MALPAIGAVAARVGAAARQAAKREIATRLAAGGGGKVSFLEYIVFLLPVAGLNDILDVFEVTGILKIVTILIDFVTALILFMWFIFRQGKLPPRYIITLIVELMPGVGILPVWTIMVTWEWLSSRSPQVTKLPGLAAKLKK